MNQPKVSVIIPVYNAEPYLVQCMESVLNQTLKEIEIICVNDGSTDSSLETLNYYADSDNRVQVISQENRSAGAARNRGLAVARGEYLSFLDADDFFEKDMLEIAYKEAVDVDADVIVFRSDRYDERTHLFHEANWTINEEYFPYLKFFSYKDIKRDFFNVFVGWTWDKLFKSEFIKKNNIVFQDQKSINDLLFVYSALAKAERIIVNQKIFAHKRFNNINSISTNYSYSKNFYCFYHALKALREQLISWKCYEELRVHYINYALYFSLWNLDKFLYTEVYEIVFENLKSKWFKELGILDEPEEGIYELRNLHKLNEIMTLEAGEYRCLSTIRNTNCGNYLFPFELVNKDSKIIIYGAGNVGRAFYKQVKYTNYCKIVAWCDKKYQILGKGYSSPGEIMKLEFDVVVIALNDKKTAEKIVSGLQELGVEHKKIIWRSPEAKL